MGASGAIEEPCLINIIIKKQIRDSAKNTLLRLSNVSTDQSRSLGNSTV